MSFSRLAHVITTDNSDGFNVTTASIDTTGANLIVIVAGSRGDNAAYSISDSKSNTYTGLTAQTNAGGVTCRIWYVYNPSVGTGHTFTLTGGRFPSLSVAAYSGSASSPFDQENGANSASTNPLASGSITPTENNELVIAATTMDRPSAPTVSGGSLAVVDAKGQNGDYGVGLAEWIQTTATAVSGEWSMDIAAPISVAIASFKAAAAAGGAVIPWLPGQTLAQAPRGARMVASGFIPPNKTD